MRQAPEECVFETGRVSKSRVIKSLRGLLKIRFQSLRLLEMWPGLPLKSKFKVLFLSGVSRIIFSHMGREGECDKTSANGGHLEHQPSSKDGKVLLRGFG